MCVLILSAAEPLGAHEPEGDMTSFVWSIFFFSVFFFCSLAKKVTLAPSWKMDWKETEDRPSWRLWHCPVEKNPGPEPMG